MTILLVYVEECILDQLGWLCCQFSEAILYSRRAMVSTHLVSDNSLSMSLAAVYLTTWYLILPNCSWGPWKAWNLVHLLNILVFVEFYFFNCLKCLSLCIALIATFNCHSTALSDARLCGFNSYTSNPFSGLVADNVVQRTDLQHISLHLHGL